MDEKKGELKDGENHSREQERLLDNFSLKDINEKHEKQLRWSLFLMAGIILIMVLIPFINNNFINKFNYHGIEFQKTHLGNLVFYSAKFPVVGGTGQVIGDYAVNLRNDPRDL